MLFVKEQYIDILPVSHSIQVEIFHLFTTFFIVAVVGAGNPPHDLWLIVKYSGFNVNSQTSKYGVEFTMSVNNPLKYIFL